MFLLNEIYRLRGDVERQYPLTAEHKRIECDLIWPSDRLEDILYNWNPHHDFGNIHLSAYDCFYDSDDWSTICQVYPLHHPDHYRCFAEKGHIDPWGEPIRLMSTSSSIDDPLANRFAYFRGKYWKVSSYSHLRPTIRLTQAIEAGFYTGWLPNATYQNLLRDSLESQDLVNWAKEGF